MDELNGIHESHSEEFGEVRVRILWEYSNTRDTKSTEILNPQGH